LSAAKPVTVFLCDDVPELRALVRQAWEHDPAIHVIGDAGDAATAIGQIAALRPQVVLLDLSMPAMDGLEALPRVKAAAPDTAVIVFSGFSAARLEQVALASGADRYVEKGTPLKSLRHTVLELAG
jgi:DNA-binding NarL/FixJ family response regulator